MYDNNAHPIILKSAIVLEHDTGCRPGSIEHQHHFKYMGYNKDLWQITVEC